MELSLLTWLSLLGTSVIEELGLQKIKNKNKFSTMHNQTVAQKVDQSQQLWILNFNCGVKILFPSFSGKYNCKANW